jgi:23S rRNA (guanosine2251-2'-O)-methyltransferase
MGWNITSQNTGENSLKEEQTSVNRSIIIGRNPVLEALKSNREIEKLIIGKDTEGSIRKIIGIAKDKGVPWQYVDKSALDRISDGKSHQGVIAYVSEYTYCHIEDIIEKAQIRNEDPFIIILDGIEDPHNLGAILRTADGAGAHGVIIPKRRAVGITDVVAKAAAGAVEYVPVAKVSNIAQTVDKLKEKGIWVGACNMDGIEYDLANMNGSIALVIGAEGYGISRLVKEKCDFSVSIPMSGHISSLNASNAAAILMYEVRRQRKNSK